MRFTKSRTVWSWLAATVCLSLLVVVQSWAASEEDMSDNVSVGRVDRDSGTIAGPVTIIEEDEIARMGAKTVVDVLRVQPGVNVRDLAGNGRLAAVDIRGGGVGTSPEKAPGVMVLVDGRPVTNPLGFATPDASINWPVIPVQNIKRIEIFRGSNSVVWGSQAYQGTINIVTKAAPEEGHRLSLGTRVGSYDSFQHFLGVSGTVEGIQYSVTGGYDTSDGYQAHNRFRTRYGALRLSGTAGDWFGWDLQAGKSEDQFDLQDTIPDNEDRLDDRPWERYESQRHYVSFIPTFVLGCGELALPMHYQQRDLDAIDFNESFQLYEYRFMPQYTALFELAGIRHNLIVGVDYYVNELEPGQGWDEPDEYRRNVGYFVHDTIALLPDELFLDLGFRRTRVHHDNTYDDDWDGWHDSYSVNSYEAGLTWVYAEGSRAFVRAARGFQDYALYEWPTITDQRFREYQVGVMHRFSDTLTGGVTLFRVEGTNEYYWDDLIPDSRRNGVELEMTYRPCEYWQVAANYMWVDARWKDDMNFTTSNTEIHGQPEHSGAVILSVFPIENLTAHLRAKVVADNEAADSDAENFTSWEGEDYVVVDGTVSYVWNDFTFYAGVNNIFGEEYSEVGEYWGGDLVGVMPMPERNFFAGVKYTKEF
ncbi:MAG: TonB-dependent receptor [Candidatus Pacebacteria bacterium]|nr:TonB-dependent receptor [Candidatus Paceibacterota bacterium]